MVVISTAFVHINSYNGFQKVFQGGEAGLMVYMIYIDVVFAVNTIMDVMAGHLKQGFIQDYKAAPGRVL